MESEKRWCRICMSDVQHEILDSGKVMVGKKTKFCINVQFVEGLAVCLPFVAWQNLRIRKINFLIVNS